MNAFTKVFPPDQTGLTGVLLSGWVVYVVYVFTIVDQGCYVVCDCDISWSYFMLMRALM